MRSDRSDIAEQEPGPALLIVEDDRRVAGALRRLVRDRAPRVWIAHSAASARARLRSAKSSAIAGLLVDYELGDGTGLEVILEARALGRDIPALVLTGHGSDALANRCAAARITYVTKPCTLAALLPFLDRVAPRRADPVLERLAREIRATAREKRVFELARAGLLQQEVAESMGVELSTVRRHASNLLLKARRQGMLVGSLAELVRALPRSRLEP